MKGIKSDDLAQQLETELFEKYGPILTGHDLIKCLGYSSLAALRQAVSRDKAPVPIFSIEERRGKFALTKDVAQWLAEQRNQICS